MKKLPLDYRPTMKDMDKGFELMAKYFNDQELTEDQEYLAELLTDAHYIYQQTGKRPTVAQVHEYWRQQRHDREQKRINSWSESYTLRENNFTEDAEPGGPLAQFISVAKELRSKSGKYPTIAEVRKALKA
jgi:hypothetical protein